MALVITRILASIESYSIASFRRIIALLTAGEVLWIILGLIGLAYHLLLRTRFNLTNTMLYAAFATAAFEFVLFSAVFTKRIDLSLGLSIMHPVALTLIYSNDVFSAPRTIVLLAGIILMISAVSFVKLLDKLKTKKGSSARTLLRSFLKVWIGGDPREIEDIFASHGEQTEISTQILKFKNGSNYLALIVPGAHPGPFYPVGSYNLPELIFKHFRGKGIVALTLHGAGGHERNIVTNENTDRYVRHILSSFMSLPINETNDNLYGPLIAKLGDASISCFALDERLIATVSYFPLCSDDLDKRIEEKLVSLATGMGYSTIVIDAHNSIDSKRTEQHIDEAQWLDMLGKIKNEGPKEFMIGFAHSSEVGVAYSQDISEAGIGVIVLRIGSEKWVWVIANSNNSIPEVRYKIHDMLTNTGYKFFELCTSDTHYIAAKGLTSKRGYFALGEATPPSDVVKLVMLLVKLAESRLSSEGYGASELKSEVTVLSEETLKDFVRLTNTASKIAKRYLLFVTLISMLLLLSVTLV